MRRARRGHLYYLLESHARFGGRRQRRAAPGTDHPPTSRPALGLASAAATVVRTRRPSRATSGPAPSRVAADRRATSLCSVRELWGACSADTRQRGGVLAPFYGVAPYALVPWHTLLLTHSRGQWQVTGVVPRQRGHDVGPSKVPARQPLGTVLVAMPWTSIIHVARATVVSW